MGNNNTLQYVTLVLVLVAIAMSAYSIISPRTTIVYRNATTSSTTTTVHTAQSFNINSALITPATSLPDAPVITTNQSFGARLTDINAPFNASELSGINNAPDSYFEIAGNMLLNNTLTNRVGGLSPKKLPSFVLNGKPVVMYFGSTTCIFCAENRWAMLLALSRFGNFSQVFKGYSAVQDGDLPTVYWAPTEYNATSTTSFGDFYSSSYFSFLAIEDAAPIRGGFTLSPITTVLSRANATGNLAYSDAMNYIISTGDFQGTPFTIWGNYEVDGVDAVVLGNSTPTNNNYELQQYSHSQVLQMFSTPSSQFAWSDYAAADVYVAMVCRTLSTAPAVCNLPAIKGIETQMGI